jgi:hypothetical protein
MTNRILIAANGPDVEAIKTGIQVIAKIANETTNHEAILFVPAKGNLQGTTLEEALGSNLTKQMLKNGSLGLPNGGKISLYTLKNFPSFCRAKSVLAVYADDKMLDKTNDNASFENIVVVPWIIEHVQTWANTWQPTIIGDSPELTIEPSENSLSPVAIEGLKSLTTMVNLATGLAHPRDRDSAIGILRILKQNKEHFDPESVKAWALQNGWKSKGANDLFDIAEKVLAGRRFRTSGGGLNPDLISILRKRVNS